MATVPLLNLPDTPPPGSDRVRQVDWWTRRCKRFLESLRASVVNINDGDNAKALVLCAAFTPAGTGPDAVQLPVPSAADGTAITWTVRRATLRAAGLGTETQLTVEKSSGSGVFSGTTVATVTLPLNSYEVTAAASGTVDSGDKLRFNVVTLGTANNLTLTVEISNP